MAKKTETKKDTIKKYEITKPNGRVIFRDNLGKYVKVYEAKGCKVKEL